MVHSKVAGSSVALSSQAGIGGPSTGSLNAIGCTTDRLFANTFGATTGLKTYDYTCPGASLGSAGKRVSVEVQAAQKNGHLGPQTRQVVVYAGANDTYTRITQMQPDGMEGIVYHSMLDTLNQIRSIAPNARIKVVGYPHIVNGANQLCLVNVTPGRPGGRVVSDKAADIEWRVQRAQRNAAATAGAQFVDVKPVSAGHEMCSNDRWIIGVLDTTHNGHANVMFHMTDHGLRAVATTAGRA